MKPIVKTLVLCALLGTAATSRAALSVTVDPSATWLGFMHVSNLPADGGAYQFNSVWGTADLRATFVGPTLTLAPNTIGDASPYWYIGGGGPGSPGNKIMDANFYVEGPSGFVSGETITFSGVVLSHSLTSAHTVRVFIKDFAPDYSSFVESSVLLSGNGVFEISLATINDPARHVQYGFQMVGVNVWATDAAAFGQVEVTAVPEPAGAALAGFGVALAAIRRRRK